MFRRKLEALDFHSADTFNHEDPKEYSALVSWLEDRKIRHYKIDEREGLRKAQSAAPAEWASAFSAYLSELECPLLHTQSQLEKLAWLIGYAVSLEYADQKAQYSKFTQAYGEKRKVELAESGPQMVMANKLDAWNFHSPEFKNDVATIASLLRVPLVESDHLLTLEACCKVVQKYFNPENVRRAQKEIKHKKFSVAVDLDAAVDKNFCVGNVAAEKDEELARMLKVLHLLFISDLRDLQSQVNDIISRTQIVTANPKTDTRLGKVGR